ncbi:hypothetical protein TNCV_1972191 [Trichonephila clavipes]|nr:hypothetical protein TNCV_1972191 [Trichonephila clavipes]
MFPLRHKWQFEKENVTPNSTVILKDENLPPCKWTMGRILETVKGSDGMVRVVKVKMPQEEYREKALRIELKSKRVLENIKSKQNNNEGSNSGNNSHLADCENPYKEITPRLSEVELYKFGVQSTKIKSEARELIESFPITNENYPLAIKA